MARMRSFSRIGSPGLPSRKPRHIGRTDQYSKGRSPWPRSPPIPSCATSAPSRPRTCSITAAVSSRRDGAGLAFWFRPIHTAVAEVPIDDRELPFLFHVRSADFQELTVQGVDHLPGRRPAAARAARRLHDRPRSRAAGRRRRSSRSPALLTQLAQQFVDRRARPARPAHDPRRRRRADPRPHRAPGLAREPALGGARASRSSPSASRRSRRRRTSRRRCASRPARRSSSSADEATFPRRALAVEKERAIAENELANRIELARREEELVARDGANARRATRTRPPRWSPQGATSATRSRRARRRRSTMVEAARLRAERERAEIHAAGPAEVLLALALQELAGRARTSSTSRSRPTCSTPAAREAGGGRAMTSPRARPRRAPDRVPRAARASRHARAGALLPRRSAAARSTEVEERHRALAGGPRAVLAAIPADWRTRRGAARRPRPLPVRARRRGRRARAGRARRQRRQVPRRPAGDRPQPRARRIRACSSPTARGRGRPAAPTSPPAAPRVAASARWRRRASTTARSCSRSTRSSSGTRSHQSARYALGARRARRAPVLLRPDRHHRHRRHRLGGEHPPRAPLGRWRCPAPERRPARVLRPRGVAERLRPARRSTQGELGAGAAR